MVPSGRGLACGLQDQRLMARPPARAGGRSGLLSGGKVETRTVTLCLLPKGTPPRPQPAQPVGGPLRAFQCEGRRPGNQREVQLPPTQPHQRRESRGKNLFPLGFFPPFLPKKWGPGRAGQGSLPFQRRKEKPTMGPARKDPVPRPSHGKGTASHPPPGPAQPSAARAAARRAA